MLGFTQSGPQKYGGWRDGLMVKGLAAKPEDPTLIPRTLMVGTKH